MIIVASRYAKSLIDLAIETKQLEEVAHDMRLIKQVCRENRDFVVLLESPVIKTDTKMAVFKAIFKDKVSATTLTFLEVVVRKRREAHIDTIAYSFDELYKEYKNITTAVVTTALPLEAAERTKIIEIVKQTATGEVELIEKTDKSLIGGFILTVDDKQIDKSIKRRLSDLRKDFSKNLYVPDLN